MLNNPRMAELHAQEAPARVRELEEWGAVFDRTRDGRILQRAFGGHSYPRLAHVGDRTGLEMIRTLQDRAVAMGMTVYMEHTITHLTRNSAGVTGAFGYRRVDGRPVLFPAKAVILATGGIGKAFEITSNSWEYSGDGQALALRAGAELIDMEFVQFHPTGMVWPPGVRGLLVTEAVRGEGGILRNKDGKRFMWDYLPEDRRARVRRDRRGGPDVGRGPRAPRARRTPAGRRSCRPATTSLGRSTPRSRRAAARPTAASSSTSATCPPDHVRRKLPSMYEQFKELADVDITAGPMEVGPTTHYIMGGIRVDADTGATTVPGLFAAGEVSGGMHGANRLGGNSLSDLLVFGQRAGAGAVAHAAALPAEPHVDPAQVRTAEEELDAPLARTDGTDPYRLREELQAVMQSLVGIFRTKEDLNVAIRKLGDIRGRAADLSGRRRPRLQPGLEPRLRGPQPHRDLRGDRPERPRPQGEPRRPQPARPSRDQAGLGEEERRRPPRRRDHGGLDLAHPRDARRAPGAGRGRRSALMPNILMRIFRGSPKEPGTFAEFEVPVEEGMVVLDALHWIQAHAAPDLAVRWNCKAAKCGSCSAEVNGRPSLTCKTRLSDFDPSEPITVEPMRAFPLIRDLVTDVSWNYEINKSIPPFSPPTDIPVEDWRWQQEDIERVQEFRKCIECFLCQDVCHVLRNHEIEKPFIGPRFLVRSAGLEMHPADQATGSAT